MQSKVCGCQGVGVGVGSCLVLKSYSFSLVMLSQSCLLHSCGPIPYTITHILLTDSSVLDNFNFLQLFCPPSLFSLPHTPYLHPVPLSGCSFSLPPSLRSSNLPGVGKPVLVIPWIVMQELDKHKSRGNDRLAGKARKAIRLLFSCFTSNHHRVRCQTMEEVGPLFYSGTSDKGPSKIGTTSLRRTLVLTPCQRFRVLF